MLSLLDATEEGIEDGVSTATEILDLFSAASEVF